MLHNINVVFRTIKTKGKTVIIRIVDIIRMESSASGVVSKPYVTLGTAIKIHIIVEKTTEKVFDLTETNVIVVNSVVKVFLIGVKVVDV